MEKQLSTRQACILLFISIVIGKIMVLPSMINYISSNDTWIVFLMAFCVDFFFCLLLLPFVTKQEQNFFVAVKNKAGKFVAYLVAILLFVLFGFKAFDLLAQNYFLFEETIYVDINKITFLVLAGVAICYLGTRQLRSLGRTIEILFFLIVASLIISVIIAVPAIKPTNIFPIFHTGFSNLARVALIHGMWFGDFLLMFFFMGNVKIEKNTTKRVVKTYIFSALAVVAIVTIFVCVFNHTASIHRNCIVDMTETLPRLLSEGRFNWIVYFTFPIASLFLMGFYAYCSISSVQFCIKEKIKSNKTVSALLLVAFFAVNFILFLNFSKYYDFEVSELKYFAMFMNLVFPLAILPVFYAGGQKKIKQGGSVWQKKFWHQKLWFSFWLFLQYIFHLQ